MKKAFLLSLLAFTASAFSAESSSEIAAGCGAPVMKCPPKPCPPPCAPRPLVCKTRNPCRAICDPISLSPASNLCDAGMYVFLNLLYWNTHIGNSDWLLRVEAMDTNPVGTNFQKNFKFAWGGRLGIGYNSSYDDWDFAILYTWFRNKNVQIAELGTGTGLTPLHTAATTVPTKAQNEWLVYFHNIDLTVGRDQYYSRKLAMRPFVGVRGAWIKQTVRESYIAGTSTEETILKGRFWGIGPLVGVNTKWILGDVRSSYLSLFGDFDGALMYGRFSHYRGHIAAVPGTPNTIAGLDQRLPVPMVRAFMGLGWDSRISQDSMNIGIKIGYEVQYWFRQNQFLHLPGEDGKLETPRTTYHRLSDDLSFHGLTLSVRLDF